MFGNVKEQTPTATTNGLISFEQYAQGGRNELRDQFTVSPMKPAKALAIIAKQQGFPQDSQFFYLFDLRQPYTRERIEGTGSMPVVTSGVYVYAKSDQKSGFLMNPNLPEAKLRIKFSGLDIGEGGRPNNDDPRSHGDARSPYKMEESLLRKLGVDLAALQVSVENLDPTTEEGIEKIDAIVAEARSRVHALNGDKSNLEALAQLVDNFDLSVPQGTGNNRNAGLSFTKPIVATDLSVDAETAFLEAIAI